MELRLKLGDVLWRKILRPYLFGKEAEDAHFFTIQTLRRMQDRNLLWILRYFYRSPYCSSPLKVFGTEWRNPVGLAAGFDKHAEVIPALEALGFGAIEVGTLTPKPQPGNPQPRLFRYPEILAVINRYGFNSVGAHAVADRLHERPYQRGVAIPIGVSIGKNKDTPESEAAKDYLEAFRIIAPQLRSNDYVKINISSPNTPQLRDIFTRLEEFLGEFVEGAKRILRGHAWWGYYPRFVLKVPPDGLSLEQLEQVVKICAKYGFVGIEATNTTTDPKVKEQHGLTEVGGLSGEPLRELATQILTALWRISRETPLDLVGVGGISQSWHADEKRQAGARAIQCYTGLVFRGPTLIHEILAAWRR